jgi:hypothetical protein
MNRLDDIRYWIFMEKFRLTTFWSVSVYCKNTQVPNSDVKAIGPDWCKVISSFLKYAFYFKIVFIRILKSEITDVSSDINGRGLVYDTAPRQVVIWQ